MELNRPLLSDLVHSVVDTISDEFGRGRDEVFGVTELDDLVGPIRAGSVTMIASGRGGGRTTLALQLALRAGPSVFLSTGLPATALAHRILAMTSGVSGDLLRHGRVSNRDWSHVSTAIRRIERMPRVDVVDRITELSHARAALDGLDLVAEQRRTVVLDGIDLGTNLGFESRSMALHMVEELAEQHPSAWVVSVGLSSADYAPPYGSAFGAFLDGVPSWVDNVVWLDAEPRSTVRRVEVYNRNGSSGSIELARRTGMPRFYGAVSLVDTGNDNYDAPVSYMAAGFDDQVEGIHASREIDS